MEIIGKVVQLGTLMEGSSQRGPWKKQELIIETLDQYPRKVCLMCWGDRVAEAQGFAVGQTIKAQISIESREFNGKWYTDVKPFRFDNDIQPIAQPQQPQPQQHSNFQSSYGQPAMPPLPEMPANDLGSDNGDDLPF